MIDDELLPDSGADPAEVRETADRLLASPEFDDSRNVLIRFFEWLWSILGSVGSGIATVVLVLSVLALFGLIGIALRRLLLTRRIGVAGEYGSSGPVIVFGEPANPGSLRDTAGLAESEGRWRAALLAHFRLMVSGLIDRGVLTGLAGRTTGEYREEIESAWPELGADFAQASRAFERAYYGDRPVGEAEAAEMRALQLRLSAVGTPSGAAR